MVEIFFLVPQPNFGGSLLCTRSMGPTMCELCGGQLSHFGIMCSFRRNKWDFASVARYAHSVLSPLVTVDVY